MPSPRVFTETELQTALALRERKASWRAIGRAVNCNEDTIRRALDPHYGSARSRGIVAMRRERRAKRRENSDAAYY